MEAYYWQRVHITPSVNSAFHRLQCIIKALIIVRAVINWNTCLSQSASHAGTHSTKPYRWRTYRHNIGPTWPSQVDFTARLPTGSVHLRVVRTSRCFGARLVVILASVSNCVKEGFNVLEEGGVFEEDGGIAYLGTFFPMRSAYWEGDQCPKEHTRYVDTKVVWAQFYVVPGTLSCTQLVN